MSAVGITPTGTVWHISDIHIGKVTDRYPEYKSVFDSLCSMIKQCKYMPTAIVITGDTFDHKTKLSPDDIVSFKYLMNLLTQFNVIIIPGNHDTNLNNPNATDLISPLCDWPNVIYSKHTEVITIGNVNFVHVSIIDQFNPTAIKSLLDQTPNPIMLYHGIVDGAKFGKHTESGRDITAEIINKTYITMLGDVHEHAFVAPHAAYAGSLIQQNRGESIAKGALVWDLATRTAQQVIVPNPHCIKIRTQGGSTDIKQDLATQHRAIEEILGTTVTTDNLTITNITTSAGQQLDDEMQLIRNEFGANVKIVNVQKNKAKLHSCALECFEHIVRSKSMAEPQTEQIIEMFKRDAINVIPHSWTIVSARWSNVLVYGPDNYIDFRNMQGLSGVIAGNQMGKSSIIDVITFGLFGKPLRGDIADMIRFGTKKLSVEIEFVVDNKQYVIKRSREGKNQPHVLAVMDLGEQPASTSTDISTSTNSTDMETKPNVHEYRNITPSTIVETNKLISDLIGSLDDFLSTGLYYDNRCDIIKMKPTQRIKELSRLFGLDNIETIVKNATAVAKDAREQLKKFIKNVVENPQQEHNNVSEQIKSCNSEIALCNNDLNDLERQRNDNTAARGQLIAYNKTQEQLAQCNIDLAVIERTINTLSQSITEFVYNSVPAVSFTDHAAYNAAVQRQHYDINVAQQKLIALTVTAVKPAAARPQQQIELLQQRLQSIGVAAQYDETLEQKIKLALEYIKELPAVIVPTMSLQQLEDKLRGSQTNLISLKEYYATREQLIKQVGKIVPVTEPTVSASGLNAAIEILNNENSNLGKIVDSCANLPSVQVLTDNLARLVPLVCKYNIEAVTEDVLRLEQISAYRFSNNCDCCSANVQLLNGKLAAARSLLETALAERKATDLANAKIQQDTINLNTILTRAQDANAAKTKINENTTMIERHKSTIAQHVAYQQYLADKANSAAIDAKLAELETKNNERIEVEKIHADIALWAQHNAATENKTKRDKLNAELVNIAAGREKSLLIAAIKQQIELHAQWNTYDVAMAEITTLEQQINAEKRSLDIIAIHDAAEKYTNYMKTQQHVNAMKSKHEIEGRIAILSQTTAPPLSDQQINAADTALTNNINTTKAKNLQNMMLHSRLQAQLENLNVEIERERIYNAEYKPIENKALLYEAYAACLKPKELQLTVVTKHIKEIELQMNKYLKLMTNFTIDFRIDPADSTIEIYTINSTASQCTIETISGFQSFILSLVFRIVLTGTLPRASDCIFIDEGFGVIDADNMTRVIKFLDEIVSNYRFAFIISHVEELQAVLQNPLYITKTADGHKINNSIGASVDPIASIENKVTCECGASVSPHSMSSHLASAKHKKTMEVINKQGVAATTPNANQNPNASPDDILKSIEVEAVAELQRCECGAVIKNNKSSLASHRKSKHHLAYEKVNGKK